MGLGWQALVEQQGRMLPRGRAHGGKWWHSWRIKRRRASTVPRRRRGSGPDRRCWLGARGQHTARRRRRRWRRRVRSGRITVTGSTEPRRLGRPGRRGDRWHWILRGNSCLAVGRGIAGSGEPGGRHRSRHTPRVPRGLRRLRVHGDLREALSLSRSQRRRERRLRVDVRTLSATTTWRRGSRLERAHGLLATVLSGQDVARMRGTRVLSSLWSSGRRGVHW